MWEWWVLGFKDVLGFLWEWLAETVINAKWALNVVVVEVEFW